MIRIAGVSILPKVLRSRSLSTLILIGFGVAVLPLAATLMSAVEAVDGLAELSEKVTRRVAQIARNKESLGERRVDLERAAKQHLVFQDGETRKTFESARDGFLGVLDSIAELAKDSASMELLAGLRKGANQAYERLSGQPASSELGRKPPRSSSRTADAGVRKQRLDEAENLFGEFKRKSDELAGALSGLSTIEVLALESQSEAVKREILVRSYTVLPISIILIMCLAFLIIRAIRQLEAGIRRLGSGDLHQPIRVVGPKDLVYLGERLEWLRSRLLDLEEAKQQYLRHVSHELKTPLATIHEGTGLLADQVVGTLNTEQLDIARILVDNTRKLEALIGGLLNYSQANAHPATMRREPFDAGAMVSAVIEDSHIRLRAKSLSVKAMLRPITILANPEQFRTIVDNLLSNAIKYSPEGGKIGVALGKAGGHLELQVEDEGPGIARDERREIFEPFFRGRAAEQGGAGGSGLGLAIVSECVAAHHGKVEALDPQPGRSGARLRVQIPCQKDD